MLTDVSPSVSVKCTTFFPIPATGHNYELTGTEEVNGENIRTYVCTNCGAITTQNMGEQ